MNLHLPKPDWRKMIVLTLAMSAVGLYAASYFVPMWGFYLFAPQYPFGLTLGIYVNRVTGDTTEINILNHYIGMAKLESAAQLERSLAVYGIGLIALASVFLVFLPGRRWAKFLALPALIYPIVFLGFMYFWMFRFGHELDPGAPVKMAPFTPKIVGTGKIGNFRTIGMPGPGFYMIAAASICVGVALWLRREICKKCGLAGSCKLVCPNFTIGRPPEEPATKSEVRSSADAR